MKLQVLNRPNGYFSDICLNVITFERKICKCLDEPNPYQPNSGRLKMGNRNDRAVYTRRICSVAITDTLFRLIMAPKQDYLG